MEERITELEHKYDTAIKHGIESIRDQRQHIKQLEEKYIAVLEAAEYQAKAVLELVKICKLELEED